MDNDDPLSQLGPTDRRGEKRRGADVSVAQRNKAWCELAVIEDVINTTKAGDSFYTGHLASISTIGMQRKPVFMEAQVAAKRPSEGAHCINPVIDWTFLHLESMG